MFFRVPSASRSSTGRLIKMWLRVFLFDHDALF